MAQKIVLILAIVVLSLVIYARPYSGDYFLRISRVKTRTPEFQIPTSTSNPRLVSKSDEKIVTLPQVSEIIEEPIKKVGEALNKTLEIQLSPSPAPPKEVTPKTLVELINSSIVQIYCGYMNEAKTEFSSISRGTGIVINAAGDILTDRHIIYDEDFKKIKTDCFVLKSPFPNAQSEKPKIYYSTRVAHWPAEKKFSKDFSDTQYYNDIALLKIGEKMIKENSKINLMLNLNYADAGDYDVLETVGKFNYLPIDWDYLPRIGDNIISVGYGTDASHLANQATSFAGKVAGNLVITDGLKLEAVVIEGNATSGFSGGALINPQTKGLVGLISWVSTGEKEGKFTVAIFRDFLGVLIKEEFNIDFKRLIAE